MSHQIAIDGPAGAGKSTIAKKVAKELGFIYVDTGAMYRAVTYYALSHSLFDSSGVLDSEGLASALPHLTISFKANASTGRPDTYLDGECVEPYIRGMEVSGKVSEVAALPFVREALVQQQQRMGMEKGVVMDGRDIGTVVFPDAELKVFVTASAEVRARRRYDELKGKGEVADYDEILRNVVERDYQDSHREVSPLRKADDAIELDNSYMTIAEQNAWLYEQFLRASGQS